MLKPFNYIDPVGRISPASPAFQMHEILQPPSTNSTRPIYYNMARPPSSLIFPDLMSCTLSTLDEFATIPALQRLHIETPTARQNCYLAVPIFNPRGITVLDVLVALYDAFHRPVVYYMADDIRLPSASTLARRHRPRSRSTDHWYGVGTAMPTSTGSELEPQRQVSQLGSCTTFAGLKLERHEEGTGIWIFRLLTAASFSAASTSSSTSSGK
jgi:hypothetical protein